MPEEVVTVVCLLVFPASEGDAFWVLSPLVTIGALDLVVDTCEVWVTADVGFTVVVLQGVEVEMVLTA